MKTKRVATQNAGKFKDVFRNFTFGKALILNGMFLVISCTGNDDLETIIGELPNESKSPTEGETPVNDESTTDKESVIIYTDIRDFNSEKLGDFYELDLNNDRIVDFTLISRFYESDFNWLEITGNPEATAVNGSVSVFPWYANPEPLDSGKVIYKFPREGYDWGESYSNWAVFTIGNCFGGEEGCFYDWENKNDKFLGLRFLINGQTHYGWARLEVISYNNWTIKDYAYNAVPNKLILAGQKK